MLFSWVMLLPVIFFMITAAVIVLFVVSNMKQNQKNQLNQQKRLNQSLPAVTIQAQITNKRTFLHQGEYGSPLRHFLTFVTPDGAVMELEVPADVFEAFHEGESGDLCIQGTQFLGFVPQALPFSPMYPQDAPAQTDAGFSNHGFGQRMQ